MKHYLFFIDLKFDMLAAIFRYSGKSVFTFVNEKADAAQHGQAWNLVDTNNKS